MDFTSIDAYLKQMYTSGAYTSLAVDKQPKIVFEALELLKSRFKEEQITERLAAIQILYMLVGEDNGYSMLRSQGVKSYSNKGVSATFEDDGSGIAPSIILFLKPRGARVGRLR